MEKDYKKLYEDALETAKAYYKQNKGVVDGVECLSIIFPELKESEDDKIRKALKSFFDSEISDYGNVEWRNGIRYGEIVAWLEKQCEQKTDEVRTTGYWNVQDIEQKSTWSKENSCYYDDICEILINLINSPKSNVNKDVVQKDLDWLMSVKESQSKPAWNDEDYNQIETIACHLDNMGNEGMAEVLRSIRDKY